MSKEEKRAGKSSTVRWTAPRVRLRSKQQKTETCSGAAKTQKKRERSAERVLKKSLPVMSGRNSYWELIAESKHGGGVLQQMQAMQDFELILQKWVPADLMEIGASYAFPGLDDDVCEDSGDEDDEEEEDTEEDETEDEEDSNDHMEESDEGFLKKK